MSDIAIRAENLGKLCRMGGPQERYQTLRDSIVGAVTGPLRRLRDPKSAINHRETIWALKDVSFKVKQGKVIGSMGRNGAGNPHKGARAGSTLLKILSRITEPSAGRVTVKGRVASLLDASRGTGWGT